MRERLHASGVRPINNIVDITNYVMLEYGQPMHAFDYSCLSDGKIVVRRARNGESIQTLDGQERKLDHTVLMINDAEKEVGIARIMGGENSKITDDGTIYQNDQAVARIQVTDFEDYDYLEKYGETYYQPIEGAKTTTADAQVKSGYLEMANVQIVSEMVNLISITRAYESNQKVVQTIDGTLDVAANQIGKL